MSRKGENATSTNNSNIFPQLQMGQCTHWPVGGHPLSWTPPLCLISISDTHHIDGPIIPRARRKWFSRVEEVEVSPCRRARRWRSTRELRMRKSYLMQRRSAYVESISEVRGSNPQFNNYLQIKNDGRSSEEIRERVRSATLLEYNPGPGCLISSSI